MVQPETKETMGKDRNEKQLEDYNDVFADIANNLVFEKALINQDSLLPGPTESIYKEENKIALKEQRRDCAKYVQGADTVISLIGLDNQSCSDPDMAIRVMGYDYGSYRKQISTGKERFAVMTAILYFGDAPWKVGNSLKQQIAVPKEFEPYVNDYKYHFIDVPRLPKEKRNRLTSDFKVVADFFAERKNPNYKPSTQKIEHVEAVLHLLKVFTGDKRYEQIEDDVMERVRKGEPATMCEFAQRMEDKGITQGISIGEEAKVISLIRRKLAKGKTAEDMAEALEVETSYVEVVLSLLNEYPEQTDREIAEKILKA